MDNGHILALTGAELDAALARAQNALPRDGSAVMNGALNFQMVNNGSGRVMKSHSDTVDYGTFMRDYDNTGNFLTLGVRANTGNAFVSGTDGLANIILHTGNKPSGSYTGNGSAASRTIETGGIGEAILIYSSYGIAIVTRRCTAILEPGGLNSLAASMVGNFVGGKLGLITTERALNNNGTEYYYQVL